MYLFKYIITGEPHLKVVIDSLDSGQYNLRKHKHELNSSKSTESKSNELTLQKGILNVIS